MKQGQNASAGISAVLRRARALVPGVRGVKRDQVTKMPHRPINVGLRFRPVGGGKFGRPASLIWEVSELKTGSDGVAYVRLVRLTQPSESKLVSLNALSSRHLYEPA